MAGITILFGVFLFLSIRSCVNANDLAASDRTRADELSRQVESIRNEFIVLRRANDDLNKSLQSAEDNNRQLQDYINQATGRIEQLKQSNTELRNGLDQFKKLITESEGRDTEIERVLSSNRRELGEAIQLVRELQAYSRKANE